MSENNPTADHILEDEKGAGTPVEDNIKSRATWTRLLYMVIAYVLVSLAGLVGSVVVVLGFLMVLFTGNVNNDLRDVGQSLARYIYENVRYLTFNTDERPFPFGGKWPSARSNHSQ
ncbi:MAG: DUF4389 domain-containing protein [Woeseiaceae bacterium]|jgi:hypothetical protein